MWQHLSSGIGFETATFGKWKTRPKRLEDELEKSKETKGICHAWLSPEQQVRVSLSWARWPSIIFVNAVLAHCKGENVNIPEATFKSIHESSTLKPVVNTRALANQNSLCIQPMAEYFIWILPQLIWVMKTARTSPDWMGVAVLITANQKGSKNIFKVQLSK